MQMKHHKYRPLAFPLAIPLAIISPPLYANPAILADDSIFLRHDTPDPRSQQQMDAENRSNQINLAFK
jgi:hypothetical protein